MMHNRKIKSVVIIFSLIAVAFVALFGINCRLEEYRAERQAYQAVKRAAEENQSAEKEALQTAISEQQRGGTPMMLVVADSNGRILHEAGETQGDLTLPDDTLIRLILESGKDEWKAGSYVYFKEQSTEGHTVLALTNSRYFRDQNRWLETSALISAGEIILIAPAAYLMYRFVGMPSRHSQRKSKRLLSDASHEIKTSLGAIGINAQVLEDQIGENDQLKYILSETDSVNKMTERMLALLRVEEPEPDMTKSFSLSEVVSEVVLSFDGATYEKHIDSSYDIEKGIFLKGDEDEFRQLVALLMENAVKYTNEQGSIRLSLHRQMGQAVLEISNSGEGIDIADLPRIFDRFYTNNRTDDDHSFGLGLAIAKTIVEKHGGTISVRSRRGGNTTFRVSV